MYKEVIKALQIENLPKNVKGVESPHSFMHKSLRDGIRFYNDDSGLEYIQFFGSVIFLLSRAPDERATEVKVNLQRKRFTSKSNYFRFYQASSDVEDVKISKILRGSKTMKLDQTNTFEREDVKAVFSQEGAWIYSRIGNNHLNRFVFLFLLAQAYNIHSESQLENVANSYDSKELDKMREFKEASLTFDVKYYFTNPVIHQRHQTRQLWVLLSNLYDVTQLHDEVKSQIQDLSDAITSQLQVKQEGRYRKWEIGFVLAGLVLAIIAL